MNPHPNELAPLLLALGRNGIELAPHPTDAGRLRHRPADLPPDLSARLRIHRAAVLGLLVGGYTPGDADAAYIVGERLGVADGLGLPTHTGSPAWLVAVAESLNSGCEIATHRVQCAYGSTDEGNNGGGEGERRIALCDRQGRGRGP